MKRIIATAVLAVGVALAIPTAANAATCGAYGLTQSANTAAPGAIVHVTSCFADAPGTPVSMTFEGTGANDMSNIVPAAASGSVLGPTGMITYDVRIPVTAVHGSVYVVSASTANATYAGDIRVVVAPSSSSGSGSGLPNTGLNFLPIVLAGGGLLVAGGLAAGIAAVRNTRKTAA